METKIVYKLLKIGVYKDCLQIAENRNIQGYSDIVRMEWV